MVPGSGAQHRLNSFGLVAPRQVGSSEVRDRTCVSCIDRWVLYHRATREALQNVFKKGSTDRRQQMFSTSLGWTCVGLEEEKSLCGVRNELRMRVRSTRAGGPQIEEAPSPRQRSYRLMEDRLHTRPCPQKVGTRAGLGVRSHLPQPPPNGRLSQSSTLNPEQAILPLLKLPHLGLPWLSSG